MTTIHPEVKVYAGDKWEFRGRLLNPNGTRMNIVDRTIEWAMIDRSKAPILVDKATITKLDAVNGEISIVITKTDTASVAPGRYTDYVRIDQETIMWTGQIVVIATPFTDVA